ncbi:hypothetical protein [Bacillus sp. J33]|nr:hypothetical protein [Bacillus sp. J33]
MTSKGWVLELNKNKIKNLLISEKVESKSIRAFHSYRSRNYVLASG